MIELDPATLHPMIVLLCGLVLGAGLDRVPFSRLRRRLPSAPKRRALPAPRQHPRESQAASGAAPALGAGSSGDGIGATAAPSSARDESSHEIDAAPVVAPVSVGIKRDLGAWKPATEHAAALLSWLQGPGGFIGELVSDEIEEIYRDMCLEVRWHPRPWAPVATELRLLLGGAKSYGYRDRKRVRVWKIPPARVAAPKKTQPIERRAA